MAEETTPKLNLNSDLTFDNPISKTEGVKGNITGVIWQPQNRVFRIGAKADSYLSVNKDFTKPLDVIDITLDEEGYAALLPELMRIVEENPVVAGIVANAIMEQVNPPVE